MWKERLGRRHSASAIAGGGYVYFLDDDGETFVVKAAPEFELVSQNSLGEACFCITRSLEGATVHPYRESNSTALANLSRPGVPNEKISHVFRSGPLPVSLPVLTSLTQASGRAFSARRERA
jgi:hypothetical protein